MATTNQAIPAGLNYCMYSLVDSDGYMTGTLSTLVAGDQTGSELGRLHGAKTAPVSVNEPDFVQATGDDTALAQFTFDSNELPNGILEFAVEALDVAADMQNTNTVDYGEIRMGVLQPKDIDRPDILLLVQGQAKSWDSGSRGNSVWHGYLMPVCTLTPLGGDKSERTPAGSRYAFTASNADTLPWGATLQTATQGTENAPIIPFIADNPVNMGCWKGDAAETVFSLGRAPVSTAKTYVWIDGLAQLSGWTLDVSAKTLTFAPAPADGAIIVAMYEYNTGA